MSFLASGVMFVVVEDRHRLRAGHHRLVDVLARRRRASVGAYLPRVSAPPEPAKLWHIAQLTRNSSPPRATSPPSPLVYSASGIGRAGGQRRDVGGQGGDLLLGELDLVLALAPGRPGRPAASGRCRPGSPPAAAPTPIRVGPALVPWALRPWQVAQLARKSFLPVLDRASAAAVPASACLGAKRGVGDPGEDQAEQQEQGDRGGVSAAGGQGVHGAVLSSVAGRAGWDGHRMPGHFSR